MIRADARAGWTLRECALNRKLNPATVGKHAKLNGIEFATQAPLPASGGKAPPTRALGVDWLERERRMAKEQLRIEIAAAKLERAYMHPYRGGWPDDI